MHHTLPQPRRILHHPARTFTVEFEHRGRRYSIFKRHKTKSAPYYIHITAKGRRYKKSLEVNGAGAAIDRAKVYIDNILNEKWDQVEKLKARSMVSTVAQLLEVYRQIAQVEPVTLKNNRDSLRWMLRSVTGSYDPETIRLTELNGSLVARFQVLMRDRAVQTAPQTEDAIREAKERALRTSRSVIRQARSIFNKRYRMVEQYEAAGLHIPRREIEQFTTCQVIGRDRKAEYFPPSNEVVQAAFAAIESQAQNQPKLFVAFWLAVGAGLRRSEIGRMRWEYLVERQDRVWISGAIGKDGERIEVPLQDRAVKALAPFRKLSGKCIEEESLEWARRLNHWMESHGWDTQKKMHELRAYTGSLIYQQDPVAAMMFLRHKSIRQTEGFYVRYSKGFRSIQVL
jgi:integrase